MRGNRNSGAPDPALWCPPPLEATRRLEQAVDLYRGNLLETIYDDLRTGLGLVWVFRR